MVRYSAWIWSPDHNRHYCASYDDNGQLLQYHWSGDHRVNAPEASHAVSPAQTPNDPRSPQPATWPSNSGYNSGYSPPGAYVTATPVAVASVASGPRFVPQDVAESVGGDKPRRHIKTGDDGRPDERLDPRYARVTAYHIPYFFQRGRVFKMLWIEPAGQMSLGQTRGSTHFSVVTYGEYAYAEIRRFVVVSNKGNFSQCIPIQTYRRKGATKPGLLVQDHGVIYTGTEDEDAPSLLYGEGITKQPIRVESKNGEQLDPESRINFGKPYAVEHNVKVMEIGMVAPEHMHLLVSYFADALGM